MFDSNEQEDKLWSSWYEEDDIERIKQHRMLEPIIGADAYITVKFLPEGKYKLYYVGDGYVNDGGSEDLPEIPLTIEQYLKVVTGYFGMSGIRHHLHEEEFYTKPFDVYPKLKELEKMFPDFEPPVI